MGSIRLSSESATQEQVASGSEAALAEIYSVSQDQVDVAVQQSTGRRLSDQATWTVSYVISASEEQAAACMQVDTSAATSSFEEKLGAMGIPCTVAAFESPVAALATTTAADEGLVQQDQISSTVGISVKAGCAALAAVAVAVQH